LEHLQRYATFTFNQKPQAVHNEINHVNYYETTICIEQYKITTTPLSASKSTRRLNEALIHNKSLIYFSDIEKISHNRCHQLSIKGMKIALSVWLKYELLSETLTLTKSTPDLLGR
jgi:hypothetical protein